MALIALRNIRCIDYLAYGAIFTRVMFLPKKKVMFFLIFFPARKAQDVRREEVGCIMYKRGETRKRGHILALF